MGLIPVWCSGVRPRHIVLVLDASGSMRQQDMTDLTHDPQVRQTDVLAQRGCPVSSS